MPVDRFIPIIIVIGIAMLLVLIGVVLAMRQRSKGPAAHEAVTGDKPAPDWVKGLAGTAGKALTRTSAANIPADAILVLHDPASSEWLVEVNGMQYRSLKDIHDDRAAGKVLEALSGLQRFAGTIPIVKPDLNPPLAGGVASAPAAPAKNVEPSVIQAMKPGTVGSSPMYPAPP